MNKQSLCSKLVATHAKTAVIAALCAVPLAGFAGSPGASNPAIQLLPPAASPKDASEPKPFDPARCKGGEKGYVYWAARDQVFKFRFDPVLPIYPRLGQVSTPGDAVAAGMTEIPPAPDPSAPEGCYSNPLRGGSVPYMNDFSDKLFLTTFGVAKERQVFFSNGYGASLQRRVESDQTFRRRKLFVSKTQCRSRKSGIQECLNDKALDLNDYSVSRTLKIEKNLLPKVLEVNDLYLSLLTPMRHRVSAAGTEMELESEFHLFDAVRLHDNFPIWSNQVDLLIPYFSSLIEHVNTAHLPRYSWAQGKSK